MRQRPGALRAERINSRVRSARWFGIGRHHLERWSIEDGAWPIFAILVFFLSLFEPWLWGWNWADVGFSEGVARGLLWSFAAVLAGNTLLFHRLLALQTPRDLIVVPWLALVRTLVASLPLAGMVALPFWRGLTQRQPRWAFQPRPAENLHFRLPGGNAKSARVPISWRTAERARWAQGALFVSFMAGFLGLLALGFGLGSIGALHPTLPILAGFAALHLAAYACARLSLQQQSADRQISPRSVAGLHALAACCLLPFPGPLASFLLRFLERSERTSGGLVWRAHAERSAERRSAGFRAMAAVLNSRASSTGDWRSRLGLPESTPFPQPGLASERRRAFLRWQALLVALEAGLLAALAQGIGRRWPAFRPTVASGGKTVFFVALAISGLGFAVWIALVVLNNRRQSETESTVRWKDAGYFLGLTFVALALGSQAGFYFSGSEEPRQVWYLFAIACALAAILKWLLAMCDLVGGRQERKPWNGTLAWLALGWVAALATRDSHGLTLATWMLAAVAFLSPLWHLLLVRARGDWLFWPVSWKELFDPRFPPGLRWRLRGVALVAVLPLGGLFAPLWPFVRARLQPAAARAWWKIQGES